MEYCAVPVFYIAGIFLIIRHGFFGDSPVNSRYNYNGAVFAASVGVEKPDAGFINNDRIFTTYLYYWIAGCYVSANFQNVK